MDIRTKLIFALVSVSLGGLLALGWFSYREAGELLKESALRQLEAVAESKKQDLEKVIRAWRDRVQLITSRTDLQLSLQALRRERDPEARDRIERTLSDALESTRALRGIAVYLPDGHLVARTGADPSHGAKVAPATFWLAEEPLVVENVSQDEEEGLRVTFMAPIRLEGELVGAAKVLLSARELLEITHDHTGLGATGETLLAQRTDAGEALILNPLRHDPGASLTRRVGEGASHDPTLEAVRGVERTWRSDARDYRGAEVWAATRYLDEFDWGLVVKVDAEEEMQPVEELFFTLGRLALSLAAFAIAAGFVLGTLFAKPIRELADVARRIHQGEHDARAQIDSNDEIGLLARTFNEMADELVEKNRELEQRVRERSAGA